MTILKNLMAVINGHMNGGSCPTGASLGECPAISELRGHYGHTFYAADLYLWPAAEQLTAATVAGWFTQAGCRDVVVSHVLDDADNDTHDGRTIDGARHWDVSFNVGEPVPWSPLPAAAS